MDNRKSDSIIYTLALDLVKRTEKVNLTSFKITKLIQYLAYITCVVVGVKTKDKTSQLYL